MRCPLATMVVQDYLRHRLDPLQRRSHPAWAYSSVDDPTRLFPGEEHELTDERLAQRLGLFFGTMEVGELPELVAPLCDSDYRDDVLQVMPHCDGWSIQDSWDLPAQEDLAEGRKARLARAAGRRSLSDDGAFESRGERNSDPAPGSAGPLRDGETGGVRDRHPR